MIERKNEIKQGAAAAVLSAAVLAGSLYINQALDYRDSFIPGTVINGVEAAGHTVTEMEEILGEYDLKVTFRDGEGLSISAEDIDYHYVADGSLDSILAQQNPRSKIRICGEKGSLEAIPMRSAKRRSIPKRSS